MGSLTDHVLSIDLTPKDGYLPGQDLARRLVEDPKGPKWVLLSGGQGAGKSYWLIWQLLRVHFINVRHVLEAGGSPESVWGILVSPTHSLLRKGLALTLEQILYESKIDYTWNHADGILRFGLGGGLYTFTAEHAERIVSVTASEAAVDEPGTPKKLDAIRRIPGRLRGPGLLRKVLMAGTPEDIISRQEFYDFIASPEAQAKHGEKGDNTRRVVFASTRENWHLEDLDGYVQTQESVLTKAQRDAYVDGLFVAFNVGRVYSAFVDRTIENGGHRIPDEHDLMTPPGRGNPLLLSLDFNVDPMCGVVAVPFTKEGAEIGLRVLDEIRIPKQGIEEGETPIGRWCDEAVERWVMDWNGPVCVYGDATAERMNVAASKTGWTLVHDHLRPVVQAKGLDYLIGVWGSNPREIDRLNSVNAAFERGQILVAERCSFLRRDLNLVGFKEGTTQIDKTDPTLTHLSDALGYLLVQRSGLVASRATTTMPTVLSVPVPSIADSFDW